MNLRTQIATSPLLPAARMRKLVFVAAVWMLICATGDDARAQAAQTSPAKATQAESQAGRVSLDRVVAVVNGELILESDVDEERRFMVFQPLRDPTAKETDDALLDRLIDRALILQQTVVQPGTPISDADVQKQLDELRKAIPACRQYDCATDAGWQRFVAAQGFTMQELIDRWRKRMEVLRFVESRFRMGIRISQAEMDTYYKDTLVPFYAKQKAAPPKEDAIADRIQEILLQEQVTKLLDDWLKALRAQGSVRTPKPGEMMP